MNIVLFKAKKYSWTNKACREALNVGPRDRIRITRGNVTIEREVRRAPVSAARVMRAVQVASGTFMLGVTQYDLTELGARIGDTVVVHNMSGKVEQPTVARSMISEGGSPAPKAASAPKAKTAAKEGKALTLGEQIKLLAVGEELEVSEAAANGSAHSAAKKIGMKVTKVRPTKIKRVS